MNFPLLALRLNDDLGQWIALAGGILGVCYLLLRPKLKRKDPLDSAHPKFSLSQQRSVEQQMSNLLVELSEMSRQISAQLDTRATKLELLIREADEKIAALRAAAQSPGGANGSDNPARDYPPAARMDAPAPSARPVIPEIDPRHTAVYALADQGRSPIQIASQLSRPSGEIELILALRPRENRG